MEDGLRTKDDFKEEEEVLTYLVKAWNKFQAMYREHPSELDDFANGIHQCQRIIGMRIARNCMPELFPIKVEATKQAYEAEARRRLILGRISSYNKDNDYQTIDNTEEIDVLKRCENDPYMKIINDYTNRIKEDLLENVKNDRLKDIDVLK